MSDMSQYGSGILRAASQMERRRNDIDQAQEQQAQFGMVYGKALINGVGEAEFETSFPVVFVREPNFTYGHSLVPNEPLNSNAFPTCSATVIEYITTKMSDDRTYYTGARVACFITGPVGMKSYVNYQFCGTELRNPVFDSTEVTGQL